MEDRPAHSLRVSGEVQQGDLQLLRQVEHRLVAGVDQLAAQLRVLAGAEGAPIGEDPPADARGGVVDARLDADLQEPVGTMQPRQTAADDHDARRSFATPRVGDRRPPGQRCRPGSAGGPGERALQETPPVDRTHRTPSVGGTWRGAHLAKNTQDLVEKQRAGHA
jgi:hypothetical protein